MTAREVVALLRQKGSKKARDGMVRYAIPSDRAFGVAMRDIQAIAKRSGRSHELALELWETGWYEARMLTAYVDEPARVTAAQMDRWCRDFDNWAICDTLCFALWDRTPHAWGKVDDVGRARRTSSSSAPRSLSWPRSRCTTRLRPTGRFSRRCR